MPLDQAKNLIMFLCSSVKTKWYFCLMCTITFHLPAKTLKQALSDLPVIDVNISSFHFPPNAHRTAQGRYSGKAVETIRAFCAISNMKCKMLFYPTARAYMTIENGTDDVLMTANIQGFKSCCTYTQWSYPFTAGLITKLVKDDIPLTENALKGHSLIIVRDWQSIYETYPNLKHLVSKGEVELIETSSISTAIKAYRAGRAPLLWGADVFKWYFEQMSMEWNEDSFKPTVEISAGIWISKQSEHYEDILNRFNLAYQLLKEQGDLDKDNFLKPLLMDKVYVEAELPN
jgi:hypothetical protein